VVGWLVTFGYHSGLSFALAVHIIFKNHFRLHARGLHFTANRTSAVPVRLTNATPTPQHCCLNALCLSLPHYRRLWIAMGTRRHRCSPQTMDRIGDRANMLGELIQIRDKMSEGSTIIREMIKQVGISIPYTAMRYSDELLGRFEG